MMNKDIALAQGGENALALPVGECGRGERHVGPLLDCGPVDGVHLPQRLEIEQSGYLPRHRD